MDVRQHRGILVLVARVPITTPSGIEAQDIGGSMITYASAFRLRPEQSPLAQNTDPLRGASGATKRRGFAKYSRVFVAPSGTKITGLFRWIKDDGTAFNISSEGTKVWSFTGSTETDITGTFIITAGTPVGFVAFNNILIAFNKGGAPHKWTGTGAMVALGGSPPTDGFVAAVWNGRVWTARNNSSIIAYSAVDNPEDWTTAGGGGTINIDKSDGDTITGLMPTDDFLYVFKRNSVHLLRGKTVSELTRHRLWEHGALNQNAVVRVGRFGFFAGDTAVWMIDGVSVTNVSIRIKPTFDAIASKVARVALGRLLDLGVWVAYDDNNDGTNDSALILDYGQAKWAKYTGINAGVFANLEDGKLISGSTSQALATQQDTGTNDDGAAINMIYETPDLWVPQWHRDKAYRALWLLVEKTHATAQVTVNWYKDGVLQGAALAPNLTVGSGGGYNWQRYTIPNARMKFFRGRFVNNAADQEITLHAYAIEGEVMEGTN